MFLDLLATEWTTTLRVEPYPIVLLYNDEPAQLEYTHPDALTLQGKPKIYEDLCNWTYQYSIDVMVPEC